MAVQAMESSVSGTDCPRFQYCVDPTPTMAVWSFNDTQPRWF